MLNFIFNATYDFFESLCTGLNIRFIIYLLCMWIYVSGICCLLLLLCLALCLRICCYYFICYKSIYHYRIVVDFLFLSFAWLNAYIEILT